MAFKIRVLEAGANVPDLPQESEPPTLSKKVDLFPRDASDSQKLLQLVLGISWKSLILTFSGILPTL